MHTTGPPPAAPHRRWAIALGSITALAVVAAGIALAPALLRSVPMVAAGGWRGWVGTINGVALITLAALPAAAAVTWLLAARHRATGMASPRRMALAEVGMVYGTVPFVWMILTPGSDPGTEPGRVSLIPLKDLFDILAADPYTVAIQVGGNLLAFAALGFFAPQRFAVLASIPRILTLAAGCSLLVEVAQFALRLDRVSSVDDVLLNAAGAGLAAWASHPWWRTTPGSGSRTR